MEEKQKIQSNILLWLDDIRDPFSYCPDGNSWLVFSPIEQPFEVVWVKSYNEFVNWITENGLPMACCFDHDLGMGEVHEHKSMSKRALKRHRKISECKTGYDCARWLVEYCIDNSKLLPLYNIQSANPVGKVNIDGLFKSFIKNQALEVQEKLTNNSIITFGKHKGEKLSDVPSDYLLYLYRKGIATGALRAYIFDNLGSLEASNNINNKNGFYDKNWFIRNFRK